MAPWTSSSITVNCLWGLHEGCFLSASCEGHVTDNCHAPSLLAYEVSSVTAFNERGLSLLAHVFLRGLLIQYGLELHHLTSCEVLHIAAFVMLCEAFLWILHHFTMWKYFFHVRAENDPIPLIRAVVLQLCLRRATHYIRLLVAGTSEG
jgi:hypothetical protein